MTRPATDKRTLLLDRTMPAPLDAAWEAWTDPAKLPLWWGPRGFTCRTHEIDLRQGGVWRFDMIGPDGTVYPNRHQFVRIKPKSAIDYHTDDDGTGTHSFDSEVRFAKVKDGTRVTLKMTFPDAATRQMVEDFGAVAFGYTTLDCLAETAAPGTLSITRIFEAPVPRVWRCWTDPQDMAHWFYPDGIQIVSADFEPLKGGAWRTVMQDPASGVTLPMRGDFETVAPYRMVFTHGWEDEAGDVATPTRVTLDLHAMGERTRLTLVQQGLASTASRDGHRTGWTQTLDHLEVFLGQP